jgi:DNA-binding transcriptional regulator LsrR (DeoR family)
MQDEPLSFRTDKHALLANVALMYFGEGLTQNDIAKRLQVSRATVVNMLREARESGIVDIRVDGRSLAASSLGLDLRVAFGLDDVYVAQSDPEGGMPRAEMLRLLGRVGAIALADLVRRNDRLGVAWGETVHALSEHVPRATTSGVKVYQMIGSKMSESVPTSESCAIAIANMLGAACFTLHAPAIASSAKVAQMFRTEPTIRAQLVGSGLVAVQSFRLLFDPVPCQAQPLKIELDGVDVFLLGAFGVGIVQPQHECATLFPRDQVVEQCGA